MSTFIDINLQDYGVQGMRKGVRRTTATSPTPPNTPQRSVTKPARPAIRTPRRIAHKSITQVRRPRLPQ